jgi:hypothetical protein
VSHIKSRTVNQSRLGEGVYLALIKDSKRAKDLKPGFRAQSCYDQGVTIYNFRDREGHTVLKLSAMSEDR